MESKKNLRKQLKDLQLGDLICVEWCDASVGKSLSAGVALDLPVKTWGIFIGVLGRKQKHIVVAQNAFQYGDGICDIDFTAIPLSWAASIKTVKKAEVSHSEGEILMKSFIMGGRTTLKTRQHKQQKVRNHNA